MYIVKLWLIVAATFILSACGGSSSETSTPPTTENPRISCVGDSITEGTGLSNPSQESYPAQLASMLGTGWEVGNFGKKSATVLKSGTTPYWNTSTFVPSHEYNPDIVVIMLGTNDAKPINWANKSQFIEHYSELIQGYKTLPSQPKVYICYPPPVYAEVAGITDARIKNEIIPKITQIASLNEVEIIDIYTTLSNKKALFPDKVHPNKEGARILAEKIYQTIY
jgi:lysophospholipase L1-like esterase